MSILSRTNMGSSSSFHEFKKQASFFFKEKIKSARLALTDVTPAELLTEEATNGNPWAPDARTMNSISKAAFEVDDYWRIVGILHTRFSKFERKNWRVSYNSLVLLEYLLTHGPESSAEEFQINKDVIQEMQSFQYIDEKGFNWGLAVRKKSERISKLLENERLLKEERDRARKVTRGIKGFGSFCHRYSSSAEGALQESTHGTFGRCNSEFANYDNEENRHPDFIEQVLVQKIEETENSMTNKLDEKNSNSLTRTSFKENMVPMEEDLHRWNFTGESSKLIEGKGNDESRVGIYNNGNHPFNETEKEATASLL